MPHSEPWPFQASAQGPVGRNAGRTTSSRAPPAATAPPATGATPAAPCGLDRQMAGTGRPSGDSAGLGSALKAVGSAGPGARSSPGSPESCGLGVHADPPAGLGGSLQSVIHAHPLPHSLCWARPRPSVQQGWVEGAVRLGVCPFTLHPRGSQKPGPGDKPALCSAHPALPTARAGGQATSRPWETPQLL